jgi:hypothetical protein
MYALVKAAGLKTKKILSSKRNCRNGLSLQKMNKDMMKRLTADCVFLSAIWTIPLVGNMVTIEAGFI